MIKEHICFNVLRIQIVLSSSDYEHEFSEPGQRPLLTTLLAVCVWFCS